MKIGVLGGGQLGRMLWEAGSGPIYHDAALCPAAAVGAPIVVGKISELEKLTSFFKSVDTYAIENEFLNIEAIEKAWQAADKRMMLPTPSLAGLAIAQDKLEQKKFFVKNGLPTSEFVEITADFLADECRSLRERQTAWQGLVLKKARMGYDGKGNFALPLQASWNAGAIAAFCQSAFQSGSRVYAEKFVPFIKEVALVSCQSIGGDFGHYPLIETIQKNGVCYLAFTALGEEANEKKAVDMAHTVAVQLNLLGTFAVEFFITAAGDLLVNEMAPRVHNSGHFTQKAARSSQFEMHLKSYVQKRFDARDFHCAGAFAMVNLLGPAQVQGPVSKPANPQVYWYDKESTSPGRKLGHIISQSNRAEDLGSLIEGLKKSEQTWQESLKP